MIKVNLKPVGMNRSMVEVEICGSGKVLDEEFQILVSRLYQVYCNTANADTAAVYLLKSVKEAISEAGK